MTPQPEIEANAAIVKWIREALEQGAVISATPGLPLVLEVRDGVGIIENLTLYAKGEPMIQRLRLDPAWREEVKAGLGEREKGKVDGDWDPV